MSGRFTRHASPLELPETWDPLADSCWQKRAFLAHAHATHPCRQRYYTWSDGGHLLAGAIVYTLPLDVLTYFPVKPPVSWTPDVHVCGIPASVSSPGLVGDPLLAARLLEEITCVEKGLFLALNLPDRFPVPPRMTCGPTLPTVVLPVVWETLEEYVASLRADYRRRFLRIRAAFAHLRRETTDCSAFTDEHYAGYRAVLAESEAKLETLPLAFFQALPPANFELTSLYDDNKLLGWCILRTCHQDAAFFLGGMPPRAQRPADLYFYITTCVLERAIARKARLLDFGQTAEIPKLRLGGRLEPRLMAATHSSGAVRLALHALAPLLTYHRAIEKHHVFRREPEQ